MNIAHLLGLLLSLLFFGLSALHIYWSVGGKWGIDLTVPIKVNGERLFKPGIVGSILVAIGLMMFGMLVLIKLEWLHMILPPMVATNGLWVIAGIFMLRAVGDFNYVGLFKRVKSSGFARMDTRFYVPLCLVISILTILVNILCN